MNKKNKIATIVGVGTVAAAVGGAVALSKTEKGQEVCKNIRVKVKEIKDTRSKCPICDESPCRCENEDR